MINVGKKVRSLLSKYDKYKLSNLEQKLYEMRKEYCDIFESLVIIECAKPIDEYARAKVHTRLKWCIKRYNKVVIEYTAFVNQLYKEYQNDLL